MRRWLIGAALAAVLVSLALSATPVTADPATPVHRPLGTSVTLGGAVYGGDYGEGWGVERPDTIYNGGVPSGLISKVHWSSWGGPVARGRGRHPIYKPRGGYYRHPVVARLKATRIGTCEGRDAYLKLLIREPRRPGGPLGPWRSWSGPQTICEPYGSYLEDKPLVSRRLAGAYWEDCGQVVDYQPITVLAHDVACGKARRILRKSWVVGQRQGETKTIHVNKFRCQIHNSAKRMVACRHGSQRILGPLPA